MARSSDTPRHRVLVIGTGSIGERHVRCFLETSRADVSICERNRELAATVARRYGLEGAWSDFDEALEHEHDAAVICTPADGHVAIARRLVARGIHVLVEKPLSTALDGTEELSREAESSRVTVAVAYVYRANPVLAAMRDAILGGRFGAPLEVVVQSGQHFPTYRPAYREIYYRDRARGGGAIQDALTHLINAAEWIVGPATEVVADAARLQLEGVAVEDTVHALARHGDVLASYSLNQHQAPNETTLTVVCERGTCRWDAHENRWRSAVTPGEPWTIELAGDGERDEVFVRQANAFLDVLSGASDPLCSLRDGVQTLRVNLALLRSLDDDGRFLRTDA